MPQPSPFLAFVISICAISIFQIGYVVAAIVPSPISTKVMMILPSLAVVMWIVDDARHRRCTPCYDFGLLVFMSFPISLIWYAVWSRGGWGLLIAIGMWALICVPSFSATMVLELLNRAN